jgi:hypothetical protein
LSAAGNIARDIGAALRPHGIFVRGIIGFSDRDSAPLLASGAPAASVVLLGNIGGSIWKPFSRWRAAPGNFERSDPLDAWSKSLIAPLGSSLGATAYFPSDAPWQPFQAWAKTAECLRPSPLGILIHPEYGLWHGYRGALAFDVPLAVPSGPVGRHPCDECRDKPCLSHCPVEAVKPAAFEVAACRTHLRTPIGQAGCMHGGCMARNACPVGSAYRYPDEQLTFHMAALHL